MKHNLNITGGNDRVKYMASAGYLEQDGIIAPSYHHRFTTRFNIDGKLTDRLSIGVNTAASYTKNRIVQAEGRHYNDGIIMSALVMFPQFPVYNTDEMCIRDRESAESLLKTASMFLRSSHGLYAPWDKLHLSHVPGHKTE